MPCRSSSRSRGGLAADRVADQQRHDVRRARHHRQPGRGQPSFNVAARSCWAARNATRRAAQAAHRRQRPADHGRRQRGGEDEPGRVAAHRVDQGGRAGDIAAHAAEGLGERGLDRRRTSAMTPSRSATPAAVRAVHPDRMHLVQIGQRAVAPGQRADRRRSGRNRRPSSRRPRTRSASARRAAAAASSCSRWARSLWRKTCFSPPDCADAGDHRGVVRARPTGSGSPAAAGRWC